MSYVFGRDSHALQRGSTLDYRHGNELTLHRGISCWGGGGGGGELVNKTIIFLFDHQPKTNKYFKKTIYQFASK